MARSGKSSFSFLVRCHCRPPRTLMLFVPSHILTYHTGTTSPASTETHLPTWLVRSADPTAPTAGTSVASLVKTAPSVTTLLLAAAPPSEISLVISVKRRKRHTSLVQEEKPGKWGMTALVYVDSGLNEDGMDAVYENPTRPNLNS
jgi:hypothetical protein